MFKQSMLVIGLGVVLAACAHHPRTSRTQPAPQPGSTPHSVEVETVVFSPEHAALVHAYYGQAGATRGPGHGGLPPGIAKNLQRGKPLPPGIARQHLPHDLLVRLPRPPHGLEYVIVAGKLLLVEAATQLVRQVLLEAVFT
jgi:hypothetical protein